MEIMVTQTRLSVSSSVQWLYLSHFLLQWGHDKGSNIILETSSEQRRTNTTDHEEHTDRNKSQSMNFLSTSQGRVFRVKTSEGYRLHVREWQFDSRQELVIYSFFKTWRPDLGPTQPPIR